MTSVYNATKFTLDDLTLAYSEEDYKPQRREPKQNTFFEFRVAEATVGQGKHGYLQVKLVCEAQDKDGRSMFKKWVSVPVPVSFGEVTAPTWAKGIWLANIRALFPDAAAYDRIEKDEITGEKIYWKGNVQVRSGKEYDAAMVESNKTIAEKAMGVAKLWLEKGDEASIEDFVGATVFGKLIASKDGQYSNVDRLLANLPNEAECCYDSKEAFSK